MRHPACRHPLATAVCGALLSLAALAGCTRTADTVDTPPGEAAVELPPMSVGTARAMGPHRTTITLTTTRPGEAPRVERQEVVWVDLDRFRARQWIDDELQVDEFRDGEIAVRRQGSGAFQRRPPRSGTEILMRTLTPFNVTIGRFTNDLEVRDAGATVEPAGGHRYMLSLASIGPDGQLIDPEGRARRMLQGGDSALPTALEGEVVVDGLGNRLAVTLDGAYHRRRSGRFADEATTVTLRERREPLDSPDELVPPVDAAILIAEQRGAMEEEADDDASEQR